MCCYFTSIHNKGPNVSFALLSPPLFSSFGMFPPVIIVPILTVCYIHDIYVFMHVCELLCVNVYGLCWSSGALITSALPISQQRQLLEDYACTHRIQHYDTEPMLFH